MLSHFHQSNGGFAVRSKCINKVFRSHGRSVGCCRRMHIHHQVVSEHDQERPVDGPKSRLNGVADSFRLKLQVGVHFEPFGDMKQRTLKI